MTIAGGLFTGGHSMDGDFSRWVEVGGGGGRGEWVGEWLVVVVVVGRGGGMD